MLKNSSILVTGATGSFGKKFVAVALDRYYFFAMSCGGAVGGTLRKISSSLKRMAERHCQRRSQNPAVPWPLKLHPANVFFGTILILKQ